LQYAIPDPGINMIESSDEEVHADKKHYRHDNFIYFLAKHGTNGYERMVQALSALT